MHLIGRLATDVEVKEVNGGSKVSSFIMFGPSVKLQPGWQCFCDKEEVRARGGSYRNRAQVNRLSQRAAP